MLATKPCYNKFMIAKKEYCLLAIITLAGLLVASVSYSRVEPVEVNQINISVFPDASPSPGNVFTLTATPIPGAYYTWIINGRVQQGLSGLGKDKIQLRAGRVGDTLKVTVEASHPTLGALRGSRTVTVSDVTLIWSADVYLPKWYKGKALPSPRSRVVVTAVPEIVLDGRRIPTGDLFFSWSVGGPSVSTSGTGMDSISIEMSDNPLQHASVLVRVEDSKGRVVKEKGISIDQARPQVSIYRSNPLGGVNHYSAVGSTVMLSSGTFDFQAEPFFFSTKRKGELNYKWSVAGISIEGTPQNPALITIDATDPRQASFPVTLAITQPANRDIFVSKGFTVFKR